MERTRGRPWATVTDQITSPHLSVVHPPIASRPRRFTCIRDLTNLRRDAYRALVLPSAAASPTPDRCAMRGSAGIVAAPTAPSRGGPCIKPPDQGNFFCCCFIIRLQISLVAPHHLLPSSLPREWTETLLYLSAYSDIDCDLQTVDQSLRDSRHEAQSFL